MRLPDFGAMYADMARRAKLHGRLKCERCGRSEPLSEAQSATYLARGWPKCCGLTMSADTPPAGKGEEEIDG